MSDGQGRMRRITVGDIRAQKGGTPIVCLTVYSTSVARLFDAHVDLLLVGDSLAMTLYGMDSTLGVDLDTMIRHGQAVMRGSQRACVVVDLPFGSYQASPAAAFDAAARVMAETGCAAVKLEGGAVMAETVAFLVARGIPVMGHVGLMPQMAKLQGGFRTQGRGAGEAERIADDARAIEQAGAFSLVLEGVMEPLARRVTEDVQIPTIGIGASPRCDGQVLVGDDLLGLYADFTPKFVKRYAEIGTSIGQAAADFAEEVRERQFPGPEHCFLPKTKSQI